MSSSEIDSPEDGGTEYTFQSYFSVFYVHTVHTFEDIDNSVNNEGINQNANRSRPQLEFRRPIHQRRSVRTRNARRSRAVTQNRRAQAIRGRNQQHARNRKRIKRTTRARHCAPGNGGGIRRSRVGQRGRSLMPSRIPRIRGLSQRRVGTVGKMGGGRGGGGGGGGGCGGREGRGQRMRCGPYGNNGYMNFLRYFRTREENLGRRPPDVVRDGARIWRELSNEVKAEYKKLGMRSSPLTLGSGSEF